MWKNVLIFMLGVGAGAAGAYLSVKKYFEKKYEEDVASVREVYTAKSIGEAALKGMEDGIVETGLIEGKPVESYSHEASGIYDMKNKDADLLKYNRAYNDILKDSGYVQEEPPRIVPASAADSESYDDYTFVDYTLFSDGIIADMNDEIVKDAKELFGEENIRKFDEDDGADILYVAKDDEKQMYALHKDGFGDTYKQATGREIE